MTHVARTIQDVQEALKAHPTIRRLSGNARAVLYTDLALVGLALRTGCLIDSLAPNDPVREFSQILERLRRNSSTGTFASRVIHLYEPTAEQSFFLNLDRIRDCVEPICKGLWSGEAASSPSFIKLAAPSHNEVMHRVPPGLQEPLEYLCKLHNEFAHQDPPLSTTLPGALGVDIAVPFAAVVLDYDVAYVPTIGDGDRAYSSSIFLSDVLVSTYECVLHLPPDTNSTPETSRISIMKFSCPQSLAQANPRLAPQAIIERVSSQLRKRVEACAIEAAVEVVCESVVYERLAL